MEQGFHVVCFGDSLTLGFQSPTIDNVTGSPTPYGERIQSWMGAKGTVSTRGICGETTKEMLGRFAEDVLDLTPHCVVILGGTNDLGWGLGPDKILTNLSLLYSQSLDQGIQPVAVTVPSIGILSPSSALDPQEEHHLREAVRLRVLLNQGIAELSRQWQLPMIDLFSHTAEGTSKFLAPQFSNDGLHLTTAGYEKLAELVWEEALKAIVERLDSNDSSTNLS